MTIDEHFIYMLILESLIFFIGIGIMYYQSKKTNDMIEMLIFDPQYASAVGENMFWSILRGIGDDKEKQEAFFHFVSICGAYLVAGAKEKVGGIADVSKLPKKQQGYLALAQQLGLDEVFKNILGGKARGAVQNAAEEAFTGW